MKHNGSITHECRMDTAIEIETTIVTEENVLHVREAAKCSQLSFEALAAQNVFLLSKSLCFS